MAQCKFCKKMDWVKDKASDQKAKDGINTTVCAGLVIRNFINKELIYMETLDHYPLNYCPQCGRKLVKQCKLKKKIS